MRTRVTEVLGSRKNSLGGASFTGGGFSPGVPDRRVLRPRCRAGGVHVFVQLNNIRLSYQRWHAGDGDVFWELWDPTVAANVPADFSRMHVETGESVRRAPGWTRPPDHTPIDIQGFVFWDPNHTDTPWHHFSGWEIHSITAWRPHR